MQPTPTQDLNAQMIQIFENLRGLQGPPSVGLQSVPHSLPMDQGSDDDGG